jgi:hypothetical protein
MELSIHQCHKIDKPFMSDLKSVQPHPIKAMDPVLNNIRAKEKAIESQKQAK